MTRSSGLYTALSEYSPHSLWFGVPRIPNQRQATREENPQSRPNDQLYVSSCGSDLIKKMHHAKPSVSSVAAVETAMQAPGKGI